MKWFRPRIGRMQAQTDMSEPARSLAPACEPAEPEPRPIAPACEPAEPEPPPIAPVGDPAESASRTNDPPASASRANSRRAYHPPVLSTLAHVDDVLEVLGPAQAGYGGMGMP